MSELARINRAPIAADPAGGPRRLVEVFLQRRSPATRRAYAADLADFAAWAEAPSPEAVLAELVAGGPGPANESVLSYKSALQDRGLSASTINRWLSTLRALLKMARSVGLCNFTLEVESQRGQAYRDTRGPAVAKIRSVVGKLTAKAQRGERQALRDLAIIPLLFHVGLRRGEVVSLDLSHFDRAAKRLSIQGKGRPDREWIELDKSPSTVAGLEAWIAARGGAPGPLFLRCDRLAGQEVRRWRNGQSQGFGPAGGRLSSSSLWRMLRKHGIRPHALRHAGATCVADRNGGNVLALMSWGRWKSADVAQRYVDNLADRAGEMRALLEGIL